MIFDNFDFNSTMDSKQIFPTDSERFSYICNYVEMDRAVNLTYPWHWHPHMEINYIAKGELELKTTNHTFFAKEGDICFVNSGEIHQVSSKDKQEGCIVYTYLFDKHFLTGTPNNAIEQKYLQPILKNHKLPAYIIHPDSYEKICMLQNILKMIDLDKKEPYGYEFEVRSELSRFWCGFLNETKFYHDSGTRQHANDGERMKTMLQYIQEHYMEKISVENIAYTVNISSRECNRCFQRSIQLSPISYLNEYRIHMAAQLLTQTNDSILSISESCGFSSVSYFDKIFYELMGCTPKNYRK